MTTDRHAETPKGVRMPRGLLERVKMAAKAGGESVNGFIVAAIEERLERREGGSTTPPAPAPAAAAEQPQRQAGKCEHRVPAGAYCRACDKIKEG